MAWLSNAGPRLFLDELPWTKGAVLAGDIVALSLGAMHRDGKEVSGENSNPRYLSIMLQGNIPGDIVEPSALGAFLHG